jgi:hypothetical protein
MRNDHPAAVTVLTGLHRMCRRPQAEREALAAVHKCLSNVLAPTTLTTAVFLQLLGSMTDSCPSFALPERQASLVRM